MGDLPVPPTARFPTQIIGKLKLEEANQFLSKHLFLIFTMMPYKIANGKSNTRKDFKKMELEFINIMRSNSER
jgi:hypothetical protein